MGASKRFTKHDLPRAQGVDEPAPASGVRARRPRASARRVEPAASHHTGRRGGVAFLEPGLDALEWGDVASFAEEFIASATGAEAVNETARDEVTVEELGGPFVDLPVERAVYASDWLDDEEPLG